MMVYLFSFTLLPSLVFAWTGKEFFLKWISLGKAAVQEPLKIAPISEIPRVRVLKEELFKQIQATKSALFADKERYREKNKVPITAIQKTAKELNKFFTYDMKLNNFEGNQSLPELMNGKWAILYSTNSGYSIGRVGPYLGNKVEQIMDYDGNQYNNTVFFLKGLVKFTINSKFTVIPCDEYFKRYPNVLDDTSITIPNFLPWKIVFDSFVVQLGNWKILSGKFPKDKLVGIWKLLYIDDQIRVFYSRNEKKEEYSMNDNLYVLQKINE